MEYQYIPVSFRHRWTETDIWTLSYFYCHFFLFIMNANFDSWVSRCLCSTRPEGLWSANIYTWKLWKQSVMASQQTPLNKAFRVLEVRNSLRRSPSGGFPGRCVSFPGAKQQSHPAGLSCSACLHIQFYINNARGLFVSLIRMVEA